MSAFEHRPRAVQIDAEDAELLRFSIPDDMSNPLTITGPALVALNTRLDSTQRQFERAFVQTIEQFTPEQQLLIQMMYCEAFRTGLIHGSRLPTTALD
jgi:hypothetical protein